MFVIDKLNLDIDTDESYFIRHITGKNYIEIEKFELEKAYFTRNSSLNLSENIFPEINKKAYKYTYSFVRSISQNSTRYSIIQLEKQVTPINLTLEKIVSLCK